MAFSESLLSRTAFLKNNRSSWVYGPTSETLAAVSDPAFFDGRGGSLFQQGDTITVVASDGAERGELVVSSVVGVDVSTAQATAATDAASVATALATSEGRAAVAGGVQAMTAAQLFASGGPARDVGVPVTRFGAKGDGTTDDTTALQAAMASGEHLYFPPTSAYYKLSGTLATSFDGQQLYGRGKASQLRQMTTGLSVISSAHSDTLFDGLHLYCADTTGGLSTGNGLYLGSAVQRAMVRGLLVQQHRQPGIMLQSAKYCKVIACQFVNSRVLATDVHTAAGHDIYAGYASQYNVLAHNHCNSGQGCGISVQAVSDGDDASYNQIINNVIKGARQYGILVYRNRQQVSETHAIFGTIVAGNTIDTVTGEVKHATDGDVYGCGIYLQGAEHTVCTHNQINRAHDTNSATVTDQLAPGAIGAINLGFATIAYNTIRASGKDGVHVSIGNTGLADARGTVKVIGNTIVDYGRDGIRGVRKDDIEIDRNLVVNETQTTGGSGINLLTTGELVNRVRQKVRFNVVKRPIGHGIALDYSQDAQVTGNEIYQACLDGIYTNHGLNIFYDDNYSRNAKNRNFEISAAVSKGRFDRNRSDRSNTGEAFADGGASAASAAHWQIQGAYIGIGTNWKDIAGTETITFHTLTQNSATPSVSGLRLAVTLNTVATTITNFVDMANGQELILYVNDANTTFKFSPTTSLFGNNQVDYTAAVGDCIKAVMVNGKIFCTVLKK